MKVMMIFRPTGAVRIFESINLCEEWYGPNTPNRYTSPKQLYEQYSERQLDELYRSIFWFHKKKLIFDGGVWMTEAGCFVINPDHFHQMTRSAMAETIWETCDVIGDHVSRPPQAQTKPGYVINLTNCKAAQIKWQSGILKLPKQVGGIIDWLVSNSYDFYTKEEIQESANRVEFLRRVQTKQDGWRIWRYYSPQLIALGCIEKTGEQV